MAVTLHISNLPWSTTEQELVDWVGAHARVRSARIIIDREAGRSAGYGFVEVDDEDAQAAIGALNGTKLTNRTITVSVTPQ